MTFKVLPAISTTVSGIEISVFWDYNNPTDLNDLAYIFYLAVDTNEIVNLVQFLTPAANTFEIPMQDHTDSNGIQTWHSVDSNTHYWEYLAEFNETNDLLDYGDGNYTITAHYVGEAQAETTIWFGIPETNDPIPQPIQEPNMTFPSHNGTAPSSVTFTWQECNDANTASIWLHLEKAGTYNEIYVVSVNDTNSGLIVLSDGFWETELYFIHRYDFNNLDGIPTEIRKYSVSEYTFTIPVAHWKMDDNANNTTVADSSGKGNNGTAQQNTSVLSAAGRVDNALAFNGNSDYITIPDSDDWDICGSSTDDWTVDFWVKHTDHSGNQTYVDHYENSIQWWKIHHLDGQGIRFRIYGLFTGVHTDTGYSGEITDSNWHHIALCKVGNEYAIYKDGTQVNYAQSSKTVGFTGNLLIGAHGTSNYFDGHMDEVRISHTNSFSASPNASITDTITVPTGEY